MKIDRNIIREHEGEIINAMRQADRSAYENTSCEYRVYIDSDGDVDYEEWLAGDNGWYQFRDEDYSRTYLHTFNHQFFDPLDEYMDPIPEDADLDAIRAECIDFLVDETDYSDIIDYAIACIEQEY